MQLYRRALLITLGCLGFLVLLAIIFLALGQKQITSGLLQTENDSGQLVVDSEYWPQTTAQRYQAPAAALLPGKTDQPVVSGEINSTDIEPLLAAWESFSPQDIANQRYRRGSDPYRRALAQVASEQSIDQLYNRQDASDFPQLCPGRGCSAGWRWQPGSFGRLRIHAYQPNEAYVTGYGIVRYRADRPQIDNRHQQLYYRAYGLLLNKSDGSWRLQRAAAETVAPLD